MILPGSYANGFAPRDGEPLYPQLWRGCVGAWAPCLGPTGRTLRDWSGFGRHGDLTNMEPGTDWVVNGGRYNLDHDGSNDYTRVSRGGANIYSDLVGDKTVCAWVKTSTPGTGYRTVISKDKTFAITIKDSVFITYDWAAASDRSSGVNVADGVWHHLSVNVKAGVTNGSTLFVDGKAAATITYLTQVGNATNDVSMMTGLDSTNNAAAEYPNGMIDDVRLYNRCLTDKETRLLAARRGIAYELAPRRRYAEQAAAFNRRRRLLVGSR